MVLNVQINSKVALASQP